jgi:hypothetical protein
MHSLRVTTVQRNNANRNRITGNKMRCCSSTSIQKSTQPTCDTGHAYRPTSRRIAKCQQQATSCWHTYILCATCTSAECCQIPAHMLKLFCHLEQLAGFLQRPRRVLLPAQQCRWHSKPCETSGHSVIGTMQTQASQRPLKGKQTSPVMLPLMYLRKRAVTCTGCNWHAAADPQGDKHTRHCSKSTPPLLTGAFSQLIRKPRVNQEREHATAWPSRQDHSSGVQIHNITNKAGQLCTPTSNQHTTQTRIPAAAELHAKTRAGTSGRPPPILTTVHTLLLHTHHHSSCSARFAYEQGIAYSRTGL